MPLLDITKPDVIKFLIENYDKTTRLRMKWNRLHADKLRDAATLHREEKGYYETDVLKYTIVEGLPTITRDHIVAGSHRKRKPIRDAAHIPDVSNLKKGHSIVDVDLGDAKDDPRLNRPDTDLNIDPIMRPIDKKQRNIIYKPLPVFGREAYLKCRSKTPPEKKYYFNETCGWEYGWRLNDSYFNKNAPKYGRVWRLTRDVLKSRTGPHPDPHHYKVPEIPGPKKCPL